MKDFSMESLERVLSHKLIDGQKINIDKYGFSRVYEFFADSKRFEIIWFKNQSTLIAGDMRVMFHSVEIANTWPSPAGAKEKMQFRDAHGECVAVLVIEWHENANKQSD